MGKAASKAHSTPAPGVGNHEGLGWGLGVLLRAYHATVGPVLGDFPHGARGYQTLATVAHGKQPNQLALATFLGIDRTVMTYLIDDLVTAGLVERRLNPADRRQRRIVATRRGLDMLADLERRVRHAEDHLLDGLGAAERETFRDLLRRVACHVRDIDVTTDPCDVAADVLAGSTRTAR
ncbi:MAG TPA: MarR family winged helix-turn-helix transcriptional regulator [Jiangellaceae bacterium]